MPVSTCMCHNTKVQSALKFFHSSLCAQRQDSRAEARALQEQFLQQAKADLEAFQQNCCAAAAAHRLPSPASPDGSPPEDGAADEQVAEQPPSSRHAEDSHTAADGAAFRWASFPFPSCCKGNCMLFEVFIACCCFSLSHMHLPFYRSHLLLLCFILFTVFVTAFSQV